MAYVKEWKSSQKTMIANLHRVAPNQKPKRHRKTNNEYENNQNSH